MQLLSQRCLSRVTAGETQEEKVKEAKVESERNKMATDHCPPLFPGLSSLAPSVRLTVC
jgi:hypothetical protein